MSEITYEVGIEDIEANHWVAYVFRLPGCFSSGETEIEAATGIQSSIEAYFKWLDPLHFPTESRIQVTEVCRSYPAEEDPFYLVNAFFADDAKPLSTAEISDALRLMERTRHDFLGLVRNLSAEQLQQPIPNDERFKTIAGIIKHVAATEWWYLDRLGLVEHWSALPDDPLQALDVSRANTRARLPELEGDTRIIEKVDERWSGRKIVRRTLWHERDHTNHIRKILQSSTFS